MGQEITLTSEITVRLIQQAGGDHMVVAAAKVSTNGADAESFANPESVEGNEGLISYLMKHRHGSPFEHSLLTFFVHAPIFVWREWHRHRIGFSYNEESGRYKQLDPVFWIPHRTRCMVPVRGWKPGRPKFLMLDEAARSKLVDFSGRIDRFKKYADVWYERIVERKRSAYVAAYEAYLGDIDDDIAMEVARSNLPVGIYSSCWVTCNPRSLMSFLSLRTHDETAKFVSFPQAEIEEAARAAEAIFATGWPITYAAFNKNGRVAP